MSSVNETLYIKGKVYLRRSIMFHCGNNSHPMIVPTMSADLRNYGPKLLHIRIDSPRQCKLIRNDMTGEYKRLHPKLDCPAGWSFALLHEDGMIYDFNEELLKKFWSLPEYDDASNKVIARTVHPSNYRLVENDEGCIFRLHPDKNLPNGYRYIGYHKKRKVYDMDGKLINKYWAVKRL